MAKAKWTWGVEAYPTKGDTEHAIASALVSDLDNRHLDTVVGPTGDRYTIRVTVEVMGPELP